jgi:hypothetical protein
MSEGESGSDQHCFTLCGFPSDGCNGLYRETGAVDGDYANECGYHCFYGRRIGDWVIKNT